MSMVSVDDGRRGVRDLGLAVSERLWSEVRRDSFSESWFRELELPPTAKFPSYLNNGDLEIAFQRERGRKKSEDIPAVSLNDRKIVKAYVAYLRAKRDQPLAVASLVRGGVATGAIAVVGACFQVLPVAGIIVGYLAEAVVDLVKHLGAERRRFRNLVVRHWWGEKRSQELSQAEKQKLQKKLSADVS